MKIRVGSQNDVNIDQIIIHPRYDRLTLSKNLMLLKLVEPLVLGSRLLPACLANPATENLFDTLILTAYTGSNAPIVQLLLANT